MTQSLPSDYVPLVRELYKLAAAVHQPVKGTFELTERCNLSCRMCYISHSATDAVRRSTELTAEQWLELARQAKDSGMVFLLLTGGEVFLRPDFFEIYQPLTRLGFILTLFTNGTLITESIASRLAEAPPSWTEVTLYGATAETYETVTGVPGSYARCRAGIEALVRQRIPLGLKSTLTRRNVNELEAMRKIAHDEGLPFSASWLISKRRDGGSSEATDWRMSAAECIKLESDNLISSTELTETVTKESSGDMNSEKNFYCQAGKATFVINPYGAMNTCIDLTQPAVHPLDIGFSAAWKQVQHFVDSAPPLDPTCLACEIRSYCPRCPAWSLLETGTLTKPVPYLCEIARARKERYAHSA
ncbi:MAG: radical SAM protein [Candidatus Electrothrix scaldis]|nr:MAG: radical SAM protein [Candidatus Electrothrix sp. GW3-3]